MLEKINDYIVHLSTTIPLELFMLIGSFVEEIVAPIPSPIVTTAAGTIAKAQGLLPISLLWLALIAAVGKTLGSLILYVIADKAEDVILGTFGAKLGVTHTEVEKIGTYFTGSIKDYFILIFIRTLPIIPSLPISVAAGILKIKIKLYTVSTFVGSYLRSLLFLVAGYTGLSALEKIITGADSIESIVQIALAVFFILFFGYIYYRRHKNAQKSQTPVL